MEETIRATPGQIEAELAPLQVIRTETVLSKLPIHNLAKKGNVDINIVRKDRQGQIDLKWIVSYSDRYGQPRQIGYKLDTIVINRRIDEVGRPIPELIRLGSLRDIASELGLGSDTSAVRKALLQNASAFITARLQYTGSDKRQRTLEAGFSRYGVIFTGDRMPDGDKADAVYIELNPRYREVLNNAVFRPLDYDYMRELPPAAQRFYEVVSRAVFAALKYQHAEARLAYSEYCTCSAQQRYYDYDRFKKQMYKIHRPHLASGYLKAVRYEAAKDGEGKQDWIMLYTPGPKAKAEYNAFTKSGRMIDPTPEIIQAEVAISPRQPKPRAGSRQKHFSFAPASAEARDETPVVAELIRRGVGAGKARELISGRAPETLIDQLEWGDHLVRNARSPILNPAGFYIHLVSSDITPPEGFETSRKRREREDAATAADQARYRRLELENEYREYRAAAVDRHIAALPPEERDRIVAGKLKEIRKTQQWSKNLPPDTVREMAERAVHMAVAETLPLQTFEEFTLAKESAGGQGRLTFGSA